MRLNLETIARHFLLPALACAAASLASAQQAKPLHFIVPYPPGGPLDIVARALAEKVAPTLGPVIVDNRPGAGGNLAAEAAPDGSTIVMGAVATHAINPWLFAKIPYDPIRDFTPITGVAQVPNVLVMNAQNAEKLGIRTVLDLVRYAKANPGKLNYGSGGNGSAGHLAGEMFKSQAGVFMVHIPYAGGNPAQLALLSGQVDLTFDNLASASSNIKSGKLRAIAVTTSVRASAMPEGPAKMAPEITQRLNKAFVEALNSPELKARLTSLMAENAASTPEQFAAFVKRELAKYEKVVKASGATVE